MPIWTLGTVHMKYGKNMSDLAPDGLGRLTRRCLLQRNNARFSLVSGSLGMRVHIHLPLSIDLLRPEILQRDLRRGVMEGMQ